MEDTPETRPDLIWRRPDCGNCGEKESAITGLGGKLICGKCLGKWNKARIAMDRKLLEG